MRALIGCLLLGVSMMVHADDDLNLNVNANAPSFVVALPANPTTGFQWSVVQYDKKLLTLSGSHYEAKRTNLIGAGGQMLFTFTLQKIKSFPASTEIKFKYSRYWEPGSAVGKVVKINFLKEGT